MDDLVRDDNTKYALNHCTLLQQDLETSYYFNSQLIVKCLKFYLSEAFLLISGKISFTKFNFLENFNIFLNYFSLNIQKKLKLNL